MKNFVLWMMIVATLGACQSKMSDENLPQPIEKRMVQTPDFGVISIIDAKSIFSIRTEIIKIAHTEKCINPKDWKLIGIGSKPCGGVSEYIAYSPDTDEVYLHEKVEAYNQKYAELAKKHNMMSDCMEKQPPIISCENGKPVLKEVSQVIK